MANAQHLRVCFTFYQCGTPFGGIIEGPMMVATSIQVTYLTPAAVPILQWPQLPNSKVWRAKSMGTGAHRYMLIISVSSYEPLDPKMKPLWHMIVSPFDSTADKSTRTSCGWPPFSRSQTSRASSAPKLSLA
ncbi:uncharacterized protein LOC127262016 [Andrographis paniculata]|uniref:uncharacterized protein LOC127262016 n=1 Tax=Andrographis paniculata TaxID=175694 RepID=UPI0021E8296F|nr:uncharacterized protein LOC127262016 [Andrographis paniculata]XP_051146444.1 uncharacterized protein LOC127262016 [Andrographis paniculata]